MDLFLRALEQEVAKLHENGIRFKTIGDTARFPARIRELIAAGEAMTARNTRLTLTIAANYGGRRDIAQAAQRYFAEHPERGERAADPARGARALSRAQLRARAGPLHPHRRRAAHLQFPAVAARVHRVLLHGPAVARFRRGGARCRDRVLPEPRTPLRPHQRAGARRRRAHDAQSSQGRPRRDAQDARSSPRSCWSPAVLRGAVPAAAARLAGARDARADRHAPRTNGRA